MQELYFDGYLKGGYDLIINTLASMANKAKSRVNIQDCITMATYKFSCFM